MYRDDQPLIARFARSTPESFATVSTFVIATARWPFWRVPAAMRDIAENGEASQALFSWKPEAYRDAWRHKVERFEACEAIYLDAWNADHARHELLDYVSRWHGFGLAKGGFFLQLTYGLSACLDSHNLERFGLSAAITRRRPWKRARTIDRAIMRYHAAVDTCGGTDGLWNSWCAHVANTDLERYKSPRAVSRLHVEALGITV